MKRIRRAKEIVSGPDYHWNRFRYFTELSVRDFRNYNRLHNKAHHHLTMAIFNSIKDGLQRQANG